MDIASLIGFIMCLGMLVFGIISAAGIGGFPSYIDVPSAIITFGGALAVTLTEHMQVGHGEVETSVGTTEDVWVADAVLHSDGVAADDGLVIVE